MGESQSAGRGQRGVFGRVQPWAGRGMVELEMVKTTLLASLLVLLAGCVNNPTREGYKITSEYAVDDPQFARTMGNLLGPPIVAGNSIKTLVNGDQIFPEMLLAIRSARISITFETF